MIDYGKVKSTIKPEPKIIDEYGVWVNTNIDKIELPDLEDEGTIVTLYEYNKVYYDKDEYIKLIDDKNEMLEAQMTDTQLALCEVYEMML